MPVTYKTLAKVRAYFEMLRYSPVFLVRTSLCLLRQGSKSSNWRVDGWMVANRGPLKLNFTIWSSREGC